MDVCIFGNHDEADDDAADDASADDADDDDAGFSLKFEYGTGSDSEGGRGDVPTGRPKDGVETQNRKRA